MSSWIKEFSNRRYLAQLKGLRFESHQREFHIFAHINQGTVILNHRERNFTLCSGDSILVPAGEIHSFVAQNESSATITFHYIDTLDAITENSGLVLPKIASLTSTKLVCQMFVHELLGCIEHPLPPKMYECWLRRLWEALAMHYDQRCYIELPNIQSLSNAKRYIQENLDQPFVLQDIADRFSIDKFQLSRQFKQVFGVSLFQHIHASRIVKAKDLLSKNVPIAEVAFLMSYSDQSHFTRFFKRFVGISPTVWVKMTRAH